VNPGIPTMAAAPELGTIPSLAAAGRLALFGASTTPLASLA